MDQGFESNDKHRRGTQRACEWWGVSHTLSICSKCLTLLVENWGGIGYDFAHVPFLEAHLNRNMIDPNAPPQSPQSSSTSPTLWQTYRPHIISAVLLIVLGAIAVAMINSGGERRRAAEPMEIRDR